MPHLPQCSLPPADRLDLGLVRVWDAGMGICAHLDRIDVDVDPSSDGCEDCQRTGSEWVHLRMCESCGHVGCCDSSPNRHATAHFQESDHPVVRSYEPGEDWFYCYAEDFAFELTNVPPAHSHP